MDGRSVTCPLFSPRRPYEFFRFLATPKGDMSLIRNELFSASTDGESSSETSCGSSVSLAATGKHNSPRSPSSPTSLKPLVLLAPSQSLNLQDGGESKRDGGSPSFGSVNSLSLTEGRPSEFSTDTNLGDYWSEDTSGYIIEDPWGLRCICDPNATRNFRNRSSFENGPVEQLGKSDSAFVTSEKKKSDIPDVESRKREVTELLQEFLKRYERHVAATADGVQLDKRNASPGDSRRFKKREKTRKASYRLVLVLGKLLTCVGKEIKKSPITLAEMEEEEYAPEDRIRAAVEQDHSYNPRWAEMYQTRHRFLVDKIEQERLC